MPETYSDLGVVVRVVDYKEADKVVTLVTKNHGLVTLIALGARRSNSKKSPHIDLFNLVSFNVSGSQNLKFLLQVDIQQHFSSVKSSLNKIRLCMTFAEIICQIIPEGVDDAETYLSLLNFLSAIDSSENETELNSLSKKFGHYLLRHLGYPPPTNTSNGSLSSYFESIINRKIIGMEIR